MKEKIKTIDAEDFLEFRKKYKPEKIDIEKTNKLAKEVSKIITTYQNEHSL